MKNSLPTNLFCSTYGHNYVQIKKFDGTTTNIACKCCEKKFLSTNQGDVIEITFGNHEVNILIDYLDYQENRLKKKTA